MNNNNIGILSRVSAAFARLRGTLDAGPGNTAGEPMSVAGHLVFAPIDSGPARVDGV